MKKLLLLLSLPLLLISCRFYEVDPGRLYRAPQPSEQDLEKYINENGIKTVVNLRGDGTGNTWYDNEERVLKKYNVKLVNIGMSAKRLPHKNDLIKLLDTFETAQRPILIHCRAGVDRTGEAAAIYEMLYMNKSKEEALDMLSPKFGHFEQFMPAKLYFIRELWQGEDWARDIYDPCTQDFKFYDKNDSNCTNTINRNKVEKIIGTESDT
jgi:protein tyrosine phosphatase (PTP) superfamily phosphohydrolase (DUF442 family)